MRLLSLIVAGLLAAGAAQAQETRVSHGLSLFGELKYPPDFTHLDYVDPAAPKGGAIKLAAIGTFDSLNPFIIKGSPASSLGLTYDTLMEGAQDEPSTEYGLLAESVEVPKDLSWVAFTLRAEAKWHDGKPVTPADVIFSFETLKKQGAPFYRFYYANVAEVTQTGPRTVKFKFAGPENRELPQIVGQLTVLPKHYWQDREFDATTLERPLGSGPYRIKSFDAGRSIIYERVADYWGRDLPVNKGRYNFDSIRFEYYRDQTIALEGFKAHGFDFRQESNSKLWATAYDFPAIKDGRVVKEEIAHEIPTGMQSFVFNLRRTQFRDPKVREALAYAFDFEWSNKNLFYGQYTRTRSYFSNSDLASRGRPQAAELAFLEPLKGRIPDQVFGKEYRPPRTDGSGNVRNNLRAAKKLLDAAGWRVKDGILTHGESGQKMEIEILLVSPAFERVVAPMVRNLKRLGVQAQIRIVDTSQYRRRLDSFDFDMVVGSWGQSLSPGNEQREFWGSAAAKREGSRNITGIENAAIDKLIDHVIFAKSRAELVAATRALDRVLLWGHYVIPNWHIRSFRVAYWNRFARPAVRPKYGLGFLDTWWLDASKDAALNERKAKGK
ncbi:MAG: extracellular solute-binding protein [Alphaproteobacteria bacterium]|jgi:microcin C transport system substrate-binding protein|nr:extracellular solute-binding protein [Alphaproteobacteria bacterium]